MRYFLEYPVSILEFNGHVVIISSVRGWGILKNASALNTSDLMNTTYGLLREWKISIKFKGIGVRHSVIRNKNVGIVKVGSSHKLLYCRFRSTKLSSIKRHLIVIRSRDIYFFKKCVFELISKFRRSAYKKKGIFFKGSVFKLKKSRKKSRF